MQIETLQVMLAIQTPDGHIYMRYVIDVLDGEVSI